jgi:predicted AAA+ superfamily ATPase
MSVKIMHTPHNLHQALHALLKKQLIDLIGLAIRHAPVVALLGPRQSGKTTLARQFAASGALPFDASLAYFDLEDPRQVERLVNARLALEPLRGLVVVDEVQRRPELFPLLRVLADREGTPARFLILGSASRDLIRQSSESLAGRIHFGSTRRCGLHGRRDGRQPADAEIEAENGAGTTEVD